MRSFLLVIALGTLGACSAPGSWDNLAGGTTPDATLAAPRLVSPLTVTTVATLRPKLKWALEGDATGAIVEMSKTRAFDGDIKTYDAKGARELVIPEDLDAGIWFWRLRGRTDAKTGTVPSKVWEVLVRGPALNGTSDVPTGSMFDLDGDGHPDLIVVGDETNPSAPGQLSPLGMIAYSKDGQSFEFNDQQLVGPMAFAPTSQAVSLAAGTDLDGDGYTDLVFGFQQSQTIQNYPPGGYITAWKGSDKGFSYDSQQDLQSEFPLLPGLQAGGDVNGDGYGDVILSAANYTAVGLGSNQFMPSLLNLGLEASASDVVSDGHPRALLGGFDANGDGVSDFVTAPILAKSVSGSNHAYVPGDSSDPNTAGGGAISPLRYTVGGADIANPTKSQSLKVGAGGVVSGAVAFATGDFNGDAIPDVASTVVSSGARQVCVWFGDRASTQLHEGPCVVAAADDAEFGVSLTAVDLDGTGIDTILLTSAAGVRAAHVDGATLAADTVIAPGFGTTLTTIWPGRPGKARWAAIAADRESVGVFEGAAQHATLPRPEYIQRNFGRAMR